MALPYFRASFFCIGSQLELVLQAAPWCRGTGDSKRADVPLGGSVCVLQMRKLYDSNFAYNVSEGYSGGLKFVTQRELSRIITKLQKTLSDRIKSVNSSVENGNKLTDRESKLFEEYVHMFEETERIY